jgi:hypothetical protein
MLYCCSVLQYSLSTCLQRHRHPSQGAKQRPNCRYYLAGCLPDLLMYNFCTAWAQTAISCCSKKAAACRRSQHSTAKGTGANHASPKVLQKQYYLAKNSCSATHGKYHSDLAPHQYCTAASGCSTSVTSAAHGKLNPDTPCWVFTKLAAGL